MCGIAGILHFNTDRAVDSSAIRRMTDAVAHRGPDGEGFHVCKNLAFGHRRLSIIDLSTGDQPMFSDDRSIVLIFNGEIYNYVELREELRTLGHVFHTNSDTEVIIKAYQQWNVECQKKLNGMWAFALWDYTQQQLFISRDRMGEKPLHYAVVDNTFLFGSEIKSLFAYGFPKIYNLEMLEIYFALGYIPAPATFFKNIYKLRAGSYLLIKAGEVKECKYWDLPEIDEDNMLHNRDEIFEKFQAILKDSVRIQMRSDVPYGAFLSGGLDSSSVVELMSETSSFPVETFTIGFKEKSFDERHLSKLVSDRFHTNHHEQLVSPDTFDESLRHVVFYHDEPFADSSSIATSHVSRFAASKVKMVLTGDGGDEVLSGYTNYQGEKFTAQYQKLPGWVRKGLPDLFSFLSKPFNNSFRLKLNRIQNVCSSSNLDFQNRYLVKSAGISLDLVRQINTGKEIYPVEEFLNDFLQGCNYKDPFYKLMYLNLKLSLPDDMLVKIDRMSMSHSLETRAPFLDYRLVEYMVQVHKNIKMKNYERKTVLRETVGQKLPGAILKAPKKGFSVPLRFWFREGLLKEKIKDLKNISPLVNGTLVDGLIRSNADGKEDNGNMIWKLFVLNKVIE